MKHHGQALAGIKVLDLSQGLAGPYCTKAMACLGAEVIKIENPIGGDSSRQMGPFLNHETNHETSAPFLYLNTGKKSITLDLTTTSGVDILKKLVPGTDVLVEDFSPGSLDNMNMGVPALQEINPAIVVASITNFGQTGPYRDFKGNSMINYAITGHMYMNGLPDREPLVGAGHIPEYEAGVQAYSAILAALYWREESGLGQHIDVSVMEAMAYFHEFAIVTWTHVGLHNQRTGNRLPVGIHPLALYPCKDGYVSISVATPDQYDNLMLLVERPDLLDDPRYEDRHDRWIKADEVDEIITPWLMEHTADEIVSLAQDLRIPSGRLNNCGQLMNDPQLEARNFWVDIDHPLAGRQTYPGAPFKMTETPFQIRRAPLLGEHNDDIYVGELGLDAKELIQLAEENII